MQQSPDGDIPPVSPASEAALTDRRRPGRRDAHPALIPLLRAPAEVPGLAEEDQRFLDDEDDDGFALVRGVIIGGLLAVPIWIFVGWLGYLLLTAY